MRPLSVGLRTVRQACRLSLQLRGVSTLSNNPHIYIFPDPLSRDSHILSLLPTAPPNPSLAIGTSRRNPPNPDSFTENPRFLPIVHSVIAENAHLDPGVQSQAAVMISSSGASLFQPVRRQKTGSSGASDQGGHGSAGRGGWVHISDSRKIPDFGRIADPEDIFGSVEVEGDGSFTDGTGNYQQSGTYRIVTNDGILGLSDFLRQKVVERLKVEESKEKK
ncbi:hypothetical protein PV10_00648 [Exophiala mesophila]|uniref:Uncharacterized protein n=1 Tax=Exophiala mesophila TaxID=212818 RepID=A0A0D1Y7T9_EXOME|nr:uncharacterized protein PV10_00648 [Exophiala mesophila]KIV96831.1 hypothetical protein PV10_00648 [Exophiala mesophila]